MTNPSPPRVNLPQPPRVQLPQVSVEALLDAPLPPEAIESAEVEVAPIVTDPVAVEAPSELTRAYEDEVPLPVIPDVIPDADVAHPVSVPVADEAAPEIEPDDMFQVTPERQAVIEADRDSRPRWYNLIESHLLVWAQSGISDVQIIAGAETWVVDKDRHVKTNVVIPKEYVLKLAEYWQSAKENLGLRSGSDLLINSQEGIFETMQQIGEYRARIIFRRQDNGYGVTMRFIPPNPPSLESNPLPSQVTDLLNANNGLFIVSGPTGSGKTTLLATLINEYNRQQHRHIYTIEDPIEFVHRPINSLITQRQIGRDLDSFAEGIKAAVRSKAQVILVGELRELAAIEAAIEAANKGHLVFATQHASSVAACVSTMVSRFPGDKQNAIRADLAEVMRIIMVQRLVPTIQGGLTPVHEIMLEDTTTTPRIKEGLFGELQGALKPERNMTTFEQSLWNLFEAGTITKETVFDFANNKDDLNWRFDRWEKDRISAQ